MIVNSSRGDEPGRRTKRSVQAAPSQRITRRNNDQLEMFVAVSEEVPNQLVPPVKPRRVGAPGVTSSRSIDSVAASRSPGGNDCSLDNTRAAASRSSSMPGPVCRERPPIRVTVKDRFPPITPAHHMIARTRILDPQGPWHLFYTGTQLSKRSLY